MIFQYYLVYYLPPVAFLGPATADMARSPERRRRAAGKCRRAPLGLCVVCGQVASGVVARRRGAAERRRRKCVRSCGRARARVWPRPPVDGGIEKNQNWLLLSSRAFFTATIIWYNTRVMMTGTTRLWVRTDIIILKLWAPRREK